MSLWIGSAPLVLASQSAARRVLLESAGLPVEVSPPGVDERAIEATISRKPPSEIAAALAREKASAVAQRMPGRLVVGADQVLSLEGQRYSKPADVAAARAQLLALRGKTHRLHSAVAVARDGATLFSYVDTAALTMRMFPPAFLDQYLDAAGSALSDSVGAYRLETIGIHLFEQVQGDHFTILGLPLLPLLGFLRQQGCLL